MNELAQSRRPLTKLLATGQLTQYSSELDDGYYEKGIVKSYTVLTTGAQSGNATIQLIHLESDTGAFTAADQTYTDAGKCGVFKAAGGETIIITGSALNNGTFTSVSADANTLVVTAGFVNEADAPMTTFKKQEIISNGNNCVVDNNTGKMWARYQSTKMGAVGNGYMPWTGVPYDIFAFCAAANVAQLGGFTVAELAADPWRVANINELFSILDHEVPTGMPDSTAFPSVTADHHFSSTTYAGDTSQAETINVYAGTGYIKPKTSSYKVFLVRG